MDDASHPLHDRLTGQLISSSGLMRLPWLADIFPPLFHRHSEFTMQTFRLAQFPLICNLFCYSYLVCIFVSFHYVHNFQKWSNKALLDLTWIDLKLAKQSNIFLVLPTLFCQNGPVCLTLLLNLMQVQKHSGCSFKTNLKQPIWSLVSLYMFVYLWWGVELSSEAAIQIQLYSKSMTFSACYTWCQSVFFFHKCLIFFS